MKNLYRMSAVIVCLLAGSACTRYQSFGEYAFDTFNHEARKRCYTLPTPYRESCDEQHSYGPYQSRRKQVKADMGAESELKPRSAP